MNKGQELWAFLVVGSRYTISHFRELVNFQKRLIQKGRCFHAKSGICDVIHKANDRFLADPWTSPSVTDYIFTIVVYGLV